MDLINWPCHTPQHSSSCPGNHVYPTSAGASACVPGALCLRITTLQGALLQGARPAQPLPASLTGLLEQLPSGLYLCTCACVYKCIPMVFGGARRAQLLPASFTGVKSQVLFVLS